MRAKGFTLVEILIATLILGIVLTTVYASYTGTFRLIRATETDAALYGMARTVLERIGRDLEATSPWKGAFFFQARPHFVGDREFTRLIFRSAAHVAFGEHEQAGGIAVIEYGVEEGSDRQGYQLIRSDSLHRDPEKEAVPTGGYLMCDRLEGLSYRFFDSTGREHDSWDNGDDSQKRKAPAMVEIRLELVNEKDPERPLVFLTRVRLPLAQAVAP